ncbi:MAG: sulfotransferase [Thermosynechococcaceae cyanobacterium]
MPMQSSNPSNNSTIRTPIFLVGAERSGTTLLRLMLDHHPQIAFCHEFEFAFEGWQDNQWPDLDRYRDWLVRDRIFRSAAVEIDPQLDYPALINSFLIQKRDCDQKKLVGATLHRYFDRAAKIWPQARFIHLVRDGRDVAISTTRMGWAGNVWTGSQNWLAVETLWDEFRSQKLAQNYFELKYEDLIYDPVENLTKLCQFLEVPYNNAMLSYPQDTTYEPPNTGLVEQWGRKLSSHKIRWVECRISNLLLARDYTLSGLPVQPLSVWEIIYLQIQDIWARALFCVRRYGWRLYILNFLARKLRLQSLLHNTQLQIDTIVEAHLQ